MAFVREIVSQEDIEKYGLKELQQYYSKLAKDKFAEHKGLDGKTPWMVDRERESWFMLLGICTIVEDFPIATGEDYYVLHYKGKNIEILMQENRKEASSNINENPFRMCWEILSIKSESSDDVITKEIIDIVTEAMIARGYIFLGKQLPNIDVKVKYIGGQE